MILELISVAIAFVSVAVALWLGLKSQRLTRENEGLQKRLLAIEEAKETEREKTVNKANLRARIENRGNHNYRLLIENTGNCEARDICIKVDGTLFDDHNVAVCGEPLVNYIGPKSYATRLLAITMGCSPPFDLEIWWKDNSGELGYYRNTLTF